MWQNTKQLNFIATVLYAVVSVLFFVTAGYWLAQRPLFVLKQLRINGDVGHMNVPTIYTGVVNQLHGNFFTIDLNRVCSAFELIPWVQQASVRRIWPNVLSVTLKEFKPLGIWNEGQLVSTDGNLFTVNEAEMDEDLPKFSGPTDSAKLVATRYNDFINWLAPLNFKVETISLSKRFAWSLKLSNGIQIEVGREREDQTLESRIKRLIQIWPQVDDNIKENIAYIDLRYPNGFAIKLKDGSTH